MWTTKQVIIFVVLANLLGAIFLLLPVYGKVLLILLWVVAYIGLKLRLKILNNRIRNLTKHLVHGPLN